MVPLAIDVVAFLSLALIGACLASGIVGVLFVAYKQAREHRATFLFWIVLAVIFLPSIYYVL